LSKDDVAGIEYVYRAFHQFGPDIVYTSTIGRQSGTRYASLMWSKDSVSGLERSYLAADSYFQVVKLMHEKNLIVPVVGDFAGPKALRAIGEYVRARGATVTAFYVSNVEDYLQRNSVWAAFCANVATFPLTEDSVFIRPGGRFGSFSPIAAETTGCK
jgi:hypothetical protein